MALIPSIIKDLIRPYLHHLRRSRRAAELKKTAPVVTRDAIVTDLKALGIARGDTVFMHSSLKSLGYVEGGPRTLLDALVDVVSSEGTVIVPTYYLPGGTIHGTCQLADYTFDPRVHGTGLGRLPEEFLKYPNVRRSVHPTHSVSAVGKHAGFVTEGHHLSPSVFGSGSPWDRLIELDGKVLGLGVSMGPITFYHRLEDLVLEAFPLAVRMSETYRLKSRLPDGQIVEVPVTPLDPAFINRRIDAPGRDDLRDYFWREFEGAGLLTIGKVGNATSWSINARRFLERLLKMMHEGVTIYSTPEELARRPH